MISELCTIAGLLVVSVGALLVLLVDVFSREKSCGEKSCLANLTGFFLIAACAAQFWAAPLYQQGKEPLFHGLVYADPYAFFISMVILLGTLVSYAIGVRRFKDEGIDPSGEFYSVYLMTVAGALVFASAAELVTLFLGLEIMSMGLYCLAGSALSIRSSAESALKYFLLGSFSSAFLLYGIALLYGLTGSTVISNLGLAAALSDTQGVVLRVALGMLLIGFGFKIGAVPFHFWAPDVYQGAPTSITGFMACVVKAAAVGVALRVMWEGFLNMVVLWSGAVAFMAVLTMTLGNFAALRQRSLKRMLAYSSIAHAGYLLVGFLAPADQFGGGPAVLFYLVSYTVMTLGAFGIVLAVTSRYSAEPNADDLSRFEGLGMRQPVLGALMCIFMLSLAGLPPGMAGLLGKFYLFGAAVKAEYLGVAIIGVLNSAVSCFYYLRVLVTMYFKEPSASTAAPVKLELSLASALALCAFAAIFLGIFPSALYDAAARMMFVL